MATEDREPVETAPAVDETSLPVPAARSRLGQLGSDVIAGFRRPVPRTEPDPRSSREIINGLEPRELAYGAALTIIDLGLTIVLYHLWTHSHTAKIRHYAPDYLITSIIGVILLGLGVFFRRRALLGFAALIVGLALLTFGQLTALLYLVFGVWLIMRVMRKGSKPGGLAARSTRTGAAPAPTRKAAPTPRAPGASKRYTPPRRVGTPAKGR